MRYKLTRALASLAVLMAVAPSCVNANQASDTYNFSEQGIASVRVGEDYRDVPAVCPGLYDKASMFVCCGGEEGDGVNIFYDDSSVSHPGSDFIVCAHLNMDDAAAETLQEKGLGCCYYSLTDSRVADVLIATGSVTIGSVTVVPSPRITVTVDGQRMATSEPAVKFMRLPGAVTTACLGEGIMINCAVGNLNMTIVNAYEAIPEEAMGPIAAKLASAMETGVFEPVAISPDVVKQDVRFDYFDYLPQY